MPVQPRPLVVFATAIVMVTMTVAAAAATPPPTPSFPATIDNYAKKPAYTCDPTVKPGTKALAELLKSTYGYVYSGLTRGCSSGTTNKSFHKMGMAFDWGVNVYDTAKRNAADEVIAWLLATDEHGNKHALARRLGITQIIWNDRIWNSSVRQWRPYNAVKNCGSYTDRCRHRNHIHFSLSADGAHQRTSWWTVAHQHTGWWNAGQVPECVGPERCNRIGFVDDGGSWALIDKVESASNHVDFYYGNPGDIPFLGDWDCDGIDTPGLYRQSDGLVYLRNSNTQGVADLKFFFGDPGDMPIVGDFDGDGCDTVSIYRPSQHRFYIINHLAEDGSGLGAADYFFSFGNSGDIPFFGDWNCDGIDTPGLYRQSAGHVYLRNSNTEGGADLDFFFGNPGDIPVAGDWNGDGCDTLSMYRPSDGNWYLKHNNTTGAANHSIHFHSGVGDTHPVAGAFDTSSGG